MKLATIRDGATTRAVRVETDRGVAVDLDLPTVREVLEHAGWRAWAAGHDGPERPLADVDYAPLVPLPSKIVCAGLNYRSHILEGGDRPIPEFPPLFAKYPPALIGANDDIVLPAESDRVDWEAELAVIVGRRVRRATPEQASEAIAGYANLNDISIRDWQRRSGQWMQGKTWEHTTPLGPWLVTPDEAPFPDGHLICEVDGELMQRADSDDMVFDPQFLVSYISTIITLEPGDVIATGTTGGVGAARRPPVFLSDGQILVTRIDGLGECRNTCRKELLPAR
jgi:acylpyruvate hydrolase